MTRNCNGEFPMRLLDCEVVDGISEKVLTFSARPRFGFNNELAIATVLMCKVSRCQARFVVTEVYRVAVVVFSFVDNFIIHVLLAFGYQRIGCRKPSVKRFSSNKTLLLTADRYSKKAVEVLGRD